MRVCVLTYGYKGDGNDVVAVCASRSQAVARMIEDAAGNRDRVLSMTPIHQPHRIIYPAGDWNYCLEEFEVT